MTPEWDDFDAGATDYSGSDEVTVQTRDAHQWALTSIEAQVPDLDDYWIAPGGARLRILTPWGYVAEVRGQSSATGHGKQGAHPAQLAQLREIREQVLIVFKDGGYVQSVWLHDPGPEIVEIDKDAAHRRQGWWVREMARVPSEEFRWPTHVPQFQLSALF